MASPTAGASRVTDMSDRARALTAPPTSRPGLLDAAFDAWFGPQEPLAPVAPREQVIGREFDYPFGVNLNYGRPKTEGSESGISFATLRQFAEPGQGGLDLLRLAIETVKDRMCAMQWDVQAKDQKDRAKAGTEDASAKAVRDLLAFPDGTNGFQQWLRMFLEDHLVLDAAVIYPSVRMRRPLLELMDGATIKRVIDNTGRTPPPPLPAYQQILKGMPAIDYTADELCYFAFNLRTNRIYGMSRVEQVINTVALGLRRFLHVQEFYTTGSMPDMVIGVPEGWTAEQIGRMQTVFDAVLSGNTGERRKVRFIPGGTTAVQLKGEILKDEFDEWLARIICFCFGLSPQALVKEMNRATAETAQEQAKDEGLEPMKLAVKGALDVVIERVFGKPGLEFVWQDEEITDPKVKAEVTVMATGGKPWMLPEEARKLYGLEELTPEELERLQPVPMDPFGLGGGGDGSPFGRRAVPSGKGEPKKEGEEEEESALDKVRKARRRSLHGYGAS